MNKTLVSVDFLPTEIYGVPLNTLCLTNASYACYPAFNADFLLSRYFIRIIFWDLATRDANRTSLGVWVAWVLDSSPLRTLYQDNVAAVVVFWRFCGHETLIKLTFAELWPKTDAASIELRLHFVNFDRGRNTKEISWSMKMLYLYKNIIYMSGLQYAVLVILDWIETIFT